jgi:membrane glycosyltransferase
MRKQMEHLPDFVRREQTDPKRFALHCLGASIVALLVGAAIDNGIAAAEKTVDGTLRSWAALFFFAQLLINVLLLLIVCWVWKDFLFWIQLTISGLMFSVLVFVVQEQLSRNALVMTSFF